jgi:protein-tyrosine phosphatase
MHSLKLNNEILNFDYNTENNIIYLSKISSDKYIIPHLEINENTIMEIINKKYILKDFISIEHKLNSYLDNMKSGTIYFDKIYISYRINQNNKKEIICIQYIFPEKNSKEFLESLTLPITNITENIFIGNLVAAIDNDILIKYKINNIVHVFEDNLNSFNLNNLMIPICDSEKENIAKYFDNFIKFIDKCDGNILIHCQHGSSRSGSFVILYLMYKYKLSFQNALFIARFKRNGIYPNEKFSSALKKFIY